MGGNGPHSGARNSSFALATLPPDRFAGITAADVDADAGLTMAEAVSRIITVGGSEMIVTLDIDAVRGGAGGGGGDAGNGGGGSVTIGIVGAGSGFEQSTPLTATGTDLPVAFPGGTLAALAGKKVQLRISITGATVYTIGFSK